MNEPTGSCLLCGLACEPEVTGLFSKGQFGICPRCRADAALGRAVRRMPAWTFIYQNSVGWFCGTEMSQGTRTYGPKADTPEEALRQAGLMEVKG